MQSAEISYKSASASSLITFVEKHVNSRAKTIFFRT